MVNQPTLALLFGAFAVGLVASRMIANEPSTPSTELQTQQLSTQGGVTAYLGLVPAEIIKGLTMSATAERGLRGHMPRRPHEYQILAALFNAANGVRISDAVVSVELSRPGSQSSRQKLTPMQIEGAATYGGVVDLPVFDRYDLKLVVERPGASPTLLQFKYDHRP